MIKWAWQGQVWRGWNDDKKILHTSPARVDFLPAAVSSGAEHWNSERTVEVRPVQQGRWESSWVLLGSDHMCPQGVWWQTKGAGGSWKGSGRGSAKSDGPKPCEALLGLSSAPLNEAAHTHQNCCHPTSHPYTPNYLTIACPQALPGQTSIKPLKGARRA